jgi:predicted membrane metal-binding protein
MDKTVKIPSDRSFGFTFAVVFTLIGGSLLWRANRFGVFLLAAAAAFALVAVAAPRVLHPLNVVWMHVGLLLNRIVNPIVMGVIFFGLFTPVALFFRLKGRDALRRSFERRLASYWIDRLPPGPDGNTFPRQF